jgi:glycosyltransferase involved in cell wall biosynthesis
VVLPIIVTPNTGGQDLVEPERTGFLVPMRSPEKLAEKFNWFADHRDRLPEMSQAAQAKAASRSPGLDTARKLLRRSPPNYLSLIA